MSVTGDWNMTMKTPMGDQKSVLTLIEEGGALTGKVVSVEAGEVAIKDVSVTGDKVAFKADLKKPMPLTVSFDLTLSGDSLSGAAKPGMFPSMPVTGSRG